LFLVVSDDSSLVKTVLTVVENGQGDERHNLVPTVQDLQNTPSDPFPTHAMETEQLHGSETDGSGLERDAHPVAGAYSLGHQVPNAKEPRTCQGRSHVTTVPLFNDSPYNQRPNPSFTSGANNIGDPRSQATPQNNQYFSQVFEQYDPYFPQTIDCEDPLFAS